MGSLGTRDDARTGVGTAAEATGMSVTGKVAAGGAGGAVLGPRLGAASRSGRSRLVGDAAGSVLGTLGEVAVASAAAGCGIPRHSLQGGRLGALCEGV